MQTGRVKRRRTEEEDSLTNGDIREGIRVAANDDSDYSFRMHILVHSKCYD